MGILWTVVNYGIKSDKWSLLLAESIFKVSTLFLYARSMEEYRILQSRFCEGLAIYRSNSQAKNRTGKTLFISVLTVY